MLLLSSGEVLARIALLNRRNRNVQVFEAVDRRATWVGIEVL